MRRIAALCLLLFAATADAAPFLWRIDGHNADHYLLGSVHLLPASAGPLPQAYGEALQQADTLVFETDLQALARPQAQTRFLAAAQAPPPQGLRGLIGAQTYQALTGELAALGMPASALDGFQPWFAAMTLELLRFTHAGFSPEYGVDVRLHARAVAAGKDVTWLESVDEQIAMLAGMSSATEEAYLQATLAQDRASAPPPAELLRIWQSNDTVALAATVEQMRRDYPALHEQVLAARNRRWLGELQRRFAGTRSQLVVVGAAHLLGRDGLLELLESNGLELSPVEDP